jgi:hypothetical protein
MKSTTASGALPQQALRTVAGNTYSELTSSVDTFLLTEFEKTRYSGTLFGPFINMYFPYDRLFSSLFWMIPGVFQALGGPRPVDIPEQL